MSSAALSESSVQLIKRIAPFLDSHVLLQFLKTHVPGTEKLQDQIAERTLINKKETWEKVEEEHRAENNQLLQLLNNHHEYQRLRQEKEFTLESLKESRGITFADCKKVFAFAKVQYEMGKYKGKLLMVPDIFRC